jgi:hypothetical protein
MSTAAPRPSVISAMASTSPANPLTTAAQIEPATTSAAADPNAMTRGRGATAPSYRCTCPRGVPDDALAGRHRRPERREVRQQVRRLHLEELNGLRQTAESPRAEAPEANPVRE